jgi:hypothetical protein
LLPVDARPLIDPSITRRSPAIWPGSFDSWRFGVVTELSTIRQTGNKDSGSGVVGSEPPGSTDNKLIQRFPMLRRSIVLVVLSLAAVACATPAATVTPTSPPTASPTAAPSASGTSSIELHQAPADMGCDSIGVDYTSLTFHIDPGAVDQVTALTNKAVTLKTYWSPGFVPGTDAERLIRDKAGKVVVHDGDPLLVPAAAYPRLAGYFVCLGPDAIYVLDPAPS